MGFQPKSKKKLHGGSGAGAKGRSDGETYERMLLPSNRVAVFRMPNIGEIVEMQEDVATETNDEKRARVVLRRLVLRRLLVGLSLAPAPVVYKAGRTPDLAALRAETQAESDARVAKDQEPLDVDGIVESVDLAAQDVDAMCAAANVQPVNDEAWDNDSHWLNTVKTARPNSADGMDWLALNRAAADVGARMVFGGFNIDPKAIRAAVRPLRRSAS